MGNGAICIMGETQGIQRVGPNRDQLFGIVTKGAEKRGWKLEGIAPEAFNGQVICRKVKQATGIEPLSVDLVNNVDLCNSGVT